MAKADQKRAKITGLQIEIEANALDSFGDGVRWATQSEHVDEYHARADPLAHDVHVPGLLPGERARVEVQAVPKSKPRRAYARLVNRLSSHDARRAAPCVQHAENGGKCTGCPLMTLKEDAQVAAKRERIERVVGRAVDRFVTSPLALGYRQSAKRVISGRTGAVVLGSYVRGSHRMADMSACTVDHPLIVEAAEELTEALNRLRVEPWHETKSRGDLRYAWFKTDGQRVLTTLISASDESRVEEVSADLRRSDAVAWSVQSSRGNAVRGSEARMLKGNAALSVTFGGEAIEVGPLGFLQPNPKVAAECYRVLCDVPPGEALSLAFDLYAGAGVTTRMLRKAFAEVVPCESYAESARDLGVEPMGTKEFLEGNERTPELIVANPPRAGFGKDVCDLLVRSGAPRLHIMSCSPESFSRDMETLSEKYRLESLEAFDTLPQTAHVELVAKLKMNFRG